MAYETLFRLYYDKLYHIAKGYLDSTQDAEGIVQNVFLKVWEQKRNLEKINNINNYLYTMTKHACLDHLKHLKIKNSFSKNYYEEKIAIQYQFIKDETSSSLLEKELEQKILEAIERLPKKCQNIFIKSRFEGMKHAEIAENLKISKKTVDNHIYNALQHMKLHLKEYITPTITFFLTFF
ncbi:RNA polymerase sigma-70 factor [Postechiella marina]|uniref:RNA polymerase sigma-70 factor n=1 Tax=Postechiella marina TaxID=943941 RepID=A0ABP8C8N0_9FLAO